MIFWVTCLDTIGTIQRPTLQMQNMRHGDWRNKKSPLLLGKMIEDTKGKNRIIRGIFGTGRLLLG